MLWLDNLLSVPVSYSIIYISSSLILGFSAYEIKNQKKNSRSTTNVIIFFCSFAFVLFFMNFCCVFVYFVSFINELIGFVWFTLFNIAVKKIVKTYPIGLLQQWNLLRIWNGISKHQKTILFNRLNKLHQYIARELHI